MATTSTPLRRPAEGRGHEQAREPPSKAARLGAAVLLGAGLLLLALAGGAPGAARESLQAAGKKGGLFSRDAEAGWCTWTVFGIKDAKNKVCCPASCARCGGEGCGDDGRAAHCCSSSILGGGQSCAEPPLAAPCKLAKKEFRETADIPGLEGARAFVLYMPVRARFPSPRARQDPASASSRAKAHNADEPPARAPCARRSGIPSPRIP